MLSPTFCWSHQPPHCAMSPVMAEDFCQDGRPGSSTAHNVAKPKLLSTNKDEVFTCLSEQSVLRIILLNIHIFSLSLNFQLGVLGPKASVDIKLASHWCDGPWSKERKRPKNRKQSRHCKPCPIWHMIKGTFKRQHYLHHSCWNGISFSHEPLSIGRSHLLPMYAQFTSVYTISLFANTAPAVAQCPLWWPSARADHLAIGPLGNDRWARRRRRATAGKRPDRRTSWERGGWLGEFCYENFTTLKISHIVKILTLCAASMVSLQGLYIYQKNICGLCGGIHRFDTPRLKHSGFNEVPYVRCCYPSHKGWLPWVLWCFQYLWHHCLFVQLGKICHKKKANPAC